MEKPKDDKKTSSAVRYTKRPASRSRKKVKTVQQFFDSTKEALFNNYSFEEQNRIIQSLYVAVKGNELRVELNRLYKQKEK